MTDDPVLAKRARIAHWVSLGQRVGYGLFGLACIAFVAGFVVGFEDGSPRSSWPPWSSARSCSLPPSCSATASGRPIGPTARAPGTDGQPIVRLTWSTARPTAAGGGRRHGAHLEEAVDHAGVLVELDLDALVDQAGRVGVALVAQGVELGGDHRAGATPARIGAERRHGGVRRVAVLAVRPR